jgi:hypothetical protein
MYSSNILCDWSTLSEYNHYNINILFGIFKTITIYILNNDCHIFALYVAYVVKILFKQQQKNIVSANLNRMNAMAGDWVKLCGKFQKGKQHLNEFRISIHHQHQQCAKRPRLEIEIDEKVYRDHNLSLNL